MPRDSVTLLHLSDPQFGKNHRFGNLGLPPPDDSFDSLLARLTDDLTFLRKEEGLVPDLVVISGDLAEEGKRSEFEDALKFVQGLLDHLELGPDRTVVIPGNHDISRPACRAYFNDCEADEIKPLPPYWPKWRHYVWFFSQLYRDQPGFGFSEGQPWTLFEIPDLELVVTGLNSTMAETHEGGKGYLGEMQLRWFQKELEKFRKQGWLRIGAVHHNVIRGAKDDDESLEDADKLERILGSSLNLLLHGHTHEAKLHWLSEKVPIFSTGSAALKSEAWPPDVLNQYQFLRIERERIQRWGRAFLPRLNEWRPDGTIARNDWRSEQRLDLVDVHGCFSIVGNRINITRSIQTTQQTPTYRLQKVVEASRLRFPGCQMTPVWNNPVADPYLRVVDGNSRYVVAFNFTDAREEVVEPFASLHKNLRKRERGLKAYFIYRGQPPVTEYEEALRRENFQLLSWREYQIVIDYSGAWGVQKGLICTEDNGSNLGMDYSFFGRSISVGVAHDAVASWLQHQSSHVGLAIGPVRFLRLMFWRLSQKLIREPYKYPLPLLLDITGQEKAVSLEALLAAQLTAYGCSFYDSGALRYMVREGAVVLLIFGASELARRLNDDALRAHMEAVTTAVEGSGKVILAGDSGEQDGISKLKSLVEAIPNGRVFFVRGPVDPEGLANKWGGPK